MAPNGPELFGVCAHSGRTHILSYFVCAFDLQSTVIKRLRVDDTSTKKTQHARTIPTRGMPFRSEGKGRGGACTHTRASDSLHNHFVPSCAVGVFGAKMHKYARVCESTDVHIGPLGTGFQDDVIWCSQTRTHALHTACILDHSHMLSLAYVYTLRQFVCTLV